ncbi:uncharacterized protein LOC120003571 [Tripterygium wilfordii]|uniref:uncharacterized protein LOC120003571 n=1 Tax=Tripterygium wilfordii TaxID=458696 RepID=UPI0018F831AE|nr:uncharacterized protein LOC120003571 [Tripterygium wilfordii]
MTQHIRPLYIQAQMNGHPIRKVLVDNGSPVNTTPITVLSALGMTEDDLIPTDVTMAGFTGEVTKAIRVLSVQLTVGSKTSLTAFFIINSQANYHALLGRDWIHTNWCVSSSLHEFLFFWKDNDVEVVWGDRKPFKANADNVEAGYYDRDIGPIKFFDHTNEGVRKAVLYRLVGDQVWEQNRTEMIFEEDKLEPEGDEIQTDDLKKAPL